MKYNILTIWIMMIMSQAINAQWNMDIFKDFTPKWINSTIDTTAWGLEGYKDNPRMFLRQSLENNGYLYSLYEHKWQNDYADGAYIEKINLDNGEKVWSTVYDLRTIEVNEKPDRMRINSKGELEIAGERFLNRKVGQFGTIKNTFVRRMYDTLSGDLIDYFFAKPDDSLNCMMEPSLAHNLFFLSDSTYQYLYSWFSYLEGKFIRNSQMDSLGRQIGGERIGYDTIGYFHALMTPEEFSLVNSDTLVAAFEAYNEFPGWGLPIDFKFYIKLYDRQLNEIKSVDMSNKLRHARNNYKLEMQYADDKMIVIRFLNVPTLTPPPYYTYKDLICDYEGNVLDSIDLVENNLSISEIIRFSEDEFIIAGLHTSNLSSAPLHIYKKKIGHPIQLLKRIEIKEKYKYICPDEIKILSNKEVLLQGGYCHWDSKYEIIRTDFPVNILFSSKDVDITSGSKEAEIGVKVIDLSPNPTTDYFTISCEATGNKKVEVLDQLGRLVLLRSIEECGDNQVDISTLNSGLYFVRLTDDEDRIVGTGKLVKE